MSARLSDGRITGLIAGVMPGLSGPRFYGMNHISGGSWPSVRLRKRGLIFLS